MPYTEKQLQKNREVMTQGEELHVQLSTHEQQHASGTIRLQQLPEDVRGKRARKFLLTCWGLAVIAIICPPHGVWTLGLFTAGIIGYFMRKKQGALILGGQANCPNCGAFQIIDGQAPEYPFQHFCTECQKRCTVDLVRNDPVQSPA